MTPDIALTAPGGLIGKASRRQSSVLAILLLALTMITGTAMRSIFSPLQELGKADLHLSDFQISLVQGLAASIPVAILSIPLGRIVDRGHRVRLLVILTALSVAGTFLTAVAPDFVTLFIARMLAGLGSICALPVALSIAADYSSVERRGRSLLLLQVGQLAGVAAAFALGGMLTGGPAMAALAPFAHGLDGWRLAHMVFAIACAALLLPLLLLREPERHEMGEAAGMPFRVAMQALWQRRRLLIPLFIGQVTVVMADTAGTIWATPVLTRDYGLQPAQFAGWMGAILLLSGICGAVIGGVVADWGQKRFTSGGMLIGAVAAAAISIPASLFPIMPSVGGFAAMIGLLLTCGAVTGLVTATAIVVLMPNELRGVCLSAFIVVGVVGGFAIAPTLVTLTSSLMGGEQHVAMALAVTGAGASLVALMGFMVAMLGSKSRDRSPTPV